MIDKLLLKYRTADIINKIIFWNIFVFVVCILFFFSFKSLQFSLPNYFVLSSSLESFIENPWTIFTYMWLHNSFLHLIFNLIVFNFSATLFLTFFSQKQLFRLYVLGGIFSGLFYLFITYFLHKSFNLIGASGAIMSVLIATTTFSPNFPLKIPLIGTVKLWHIALFFIFIDVIQLPFSNLGGRIAHFGGALFGFLFVFLLRNGINIIDWVEFFKPNKRSTFNKKNKNLKTVHKTTYYNIDNKTLVKQKKIDEILDKISASGYNSLTKEEKDFLFNASKE